MKHTRLLMGMPVTVEVVDNGIKMEDINSVYDYFSYIDDTFSTYKETSEISRINKGLLSTKEYSSDMKVILELCEQTKQETNGYFNILHNGLLDPSGLVKGWAVKKASYLLKQRGYVNYYVDAGGDIQVSGHNGNGKSWIIGIRNPFNRHENIKILSLTDKGVATSGTAIRGQHVYNPHKIDEPITDIVSLTVIGPDVFEADRFATAVFAMGKKGIYFIEKLKGFEGYMIDSQGIATYTEGFEKYIFYEENRK